ncbi:efflux RND transporter permease subunit [Terracidiphilus sp.]|jgi:cobalt-zinc-cadmium resistance protein CzcA|uniref:efflux RND transporter permease subunit n=1 Tax=Terracidiphilus sp. TaxID=1964191 RepID=UPI003C2A5AD9
MIKALVDFALKSPFIILGMAILLFGWGAISFKNLPIDAYPDVANNYVNIITQWPGHSAEDIEKQVTVPTEIQMAGIPHMDNLRSFTLAGISSIMMNFDDSSDNNWNRERVLERLSMVTLPAGLVPQLQTDWSPAGQIYWYTLESKNPAYDVMELKSIADWTLEKQYKSVPHVVDQATFGGLTKEYQIRLDPNKLISYGLSISQVEQQLAGNNANAGGSYIQMGPQQINVQAQGLFQTVQDIENTVVASANGASIRIKDIAVVEQGPKIRLGQISKAWRDEKTGNIIDEPDVVEGTVLLQKGDDADPALKGIEAKTDELNNGLLPKGVKVTPFLDRSVLVKFTTHTVLHNLTEGLILVVIVLFIFLGNARGAFIVACTIPFSLLFAATCLNLNHIPANLLSLGALDFGMVVDGAVVMIENIIRHLSKEDPSRTPIQKIRDAAQEVQRPVFFAVAIIIAAYLPIYTLQSVEGKLFRPMAWTVGFALAGAMLFSIVIAPVLASLLFRKGAKEWHNPVMTWMTNCYRTALRWAIHRRPVILAGAVACLALTLYLGFSGVIGSEFLPHLDEGSIWARGTLAPSTGPDESYRISTQARHIMASFPEVINVVDQIGRPDDGTDSTGFFDTEYNINLKPKDEWRPVFHENKEALIDSMDKQLEKIPGVIWGFSQPIEDNMEEAVSGVKGELSVKIYGDDLRTLETKGNEIVSVLSKVPGVADLGLLRIIGQPNLTFVVDRAACARYGINVANVQDAVQTAVGGSAVTQLLQGEAQFDVALRYQKQYRDTREAIENIRLLAPSGERVSLAQLTKVNTDDGAEEIYREGEQRYIAIKYSVRGRDLGSTVEEAIKKVHSDIQLPRGYHLDWAGEYKSKQRADARLAVVSPITMLIIFLILYAMFRSLKWAMLIMLNVMLAPMGGLLALLITHTNFSVSAAIGMLALFGVSVQTGVIMLEYINQIRARRRGMEESNEDHIREAAVEGAVLRLRPIIITMSVATLGLIPAALSHAIGSDSQRPFAIVIVGGLITALLISVFLLPTLYVWFAGENDILPAVDISEEF